MVPANHTQRPLQKPLPMPGTRPPPTFSIQTLWKGYKRHGARRHSIILSARSKIDVGISILSALAVLRFTARVQILSAAQQEDWPDFRRVKFGRHGRFDDSGLRWLEINT
jgi:hypothetical protein